MVSAPAAAAEDDADEHQGLQGANERRELLVQGEEHEDEAKMRARGEDSSGGGAGGAGAFGLRADDQELALQSLDGCGEGDKVAQGPLGWSRYLSFVCLGFAPAYLLPIALFMQVPFYETVAEHWERLPSQLNVAVNLGTIPAFSLALAQYALRRTMRLRTLVGSLILAETATMIFIAIAWPATVRIGGSQLCWAAIAAGFVGGMVGASGDIFNPPFLMNAHPMAISAFFTGANSAVLLSALLAALQQPGSARRFTPAVFYALLSLLVFTSVLVFYRKVLIIAWQRVSQKYARASGRSDTFFVGSTRGGGDGRIKMPSVRGQVMNWRWMSRVLPMAVTNFALQFGCWGIMASAMPYAASRIDGDCKGGGGGGILQWVYIATYGSLVIGSVVGGFVHVGGAAVEKVVALEPLGSTTVSEANGKSGNGDTVDLVAPGEGRGGMLRKDLVLIVVPLAIFFVLFFFIITISLGLWTSGGAGPLSSAFGAVVLVLAAGSSRFFDGFLQVMFNKIVFARFGDGDREGAALIVGAGGKLAVLFGSLVALPLVSYLDRHCSSS